MDNNQGSGQASAQDPITASAGQGYDFDGLGDSPDSSNEPAQVDEIDSDISAEELAAGHTKLVPKVQAQPKPGKGDDKSDDNKSSKDARKSQEEWQSMKEKVEDSKTDSELANVLRKALGITAEEVKESDDPEQLMLDRITKLERDNERKDFEANNPKVRTEQYSEKWKEIVGLHNDPNHKYHKLDYSDLMAIIERSNPELERAEAEYRKQQKRPEFSGSVPVSGRSSVAPTGLSGIEAQASAAMGYTLEDHKAAGTL